MTAHLAGLFILACWITFLAYWIVAAFSVKPTAEKQGAMWRWGWPALLLVTFLLFRNAGVLPSYIRYTHTLLWSYTPAVGIIADLVALAGLIVMLWARTVLGGNWSGDVVFKQNHELIERGVYRYVRHPIYSGLFLMVLGAAILHGRIGGFLAFVLFVLVFSFKAHQEERLLTRHFPEAYPRYRERVKAFIPFVW